MTVQSIAAVLIADPDTVSGRRLQQLLGDAGFEVRLLAGDSAVRTCLQNNIYHVLVLDAHLAAANDCELLKQLPGMTKGKLAVVITADSQDSSAEQLVHRLLRAGADAVCYKPFDSAQTVDIVRQLAVGDQPQSG